MLAYILIHHILAASILFGAFCNIDMVESLFSYFAQWMMNFLQHQVFEAKLISDHCGYLSKARHSPLFKVQLYCLAASHSFGRRTDELLTKHCFFVEQYAISGHCRLYALALREKSTKYISSHRQHLQSTIVPWFAKGPRVQFCRRHPGGDKMQSQSWVFTKKHFLLEMVTWCVQLRMILFRSVYFLLADKDS